MLMQCVNFVRGSVRIAICGAGLERFLNICAANGIAFWGVRRISEERMEASVRISGFFALRPFARRCMCRIRVLGKYGAPFYGKRARRRYTLLAGMLVCGILLYVMSGFVWTIGIEGCSSVTPAEVLALLEQNGLGVGTRAGAVDVHKLQNTVLEKDARLSYLVINIKGSHAQIMVRERENTEGAIEGDEPCDVVADKTGVVEKLIVRSGKAETEVGKTLQDGDLIASGTMVSQQGETWLVQADAEAQIRTWPTVRLALSDSLDEAVETGRQTTRWAVVIGTKRFNLYPVESAPYACYDKKVEKKTLSVSENLRFPLTLVSETYIELERRPLSVSEERCSETLHARLLDMLTRQAGCLSVTELGYTFERQEGRWLAVLEAECLERCGVQVPLGSAVPRQP